MKSPKTLHVHPSYVLCTVGGAVGFIALTSIVMLGGGARPALWAYLCAALVAIAGLPGGLAAGWSMFPLEPRSFFGALVRGTALAAVAWVLALLVVRSSPLLLLCGAVVYGWSTAVLAWSSQGVSPAMTLGWPGDDKAAA